MLGANCNSNANVAHSNVAIEYYTCAGFEITIRAKKMCFSCLFLHLKSVAYVEKFLFFFRYVDMF